MGCGSSIEAFPMETHSQVQHLDIETQTEPQEHSYIGVTTKKDLKIKSISERKITFMNETCFPVRLNILYTEYSGISMKGVEIEEILIPSIPLIIEMNLHDIVAISYTQGWHRVFESMCINKFLPNSIVKIIQSDKDGFYIIRSGKSKKITSYNHKGKDEFQMIKDEFQMIKDEFQMIKDEDQK